MRPTTPRPAVADTPELRDPDRDASYDRPDPRIHSAPTTPAKPFTRTPQFWAVMVLSAVGIAIVALAQPAEGPTLLPAWTMWVGYGTAAVGVTALFILWVLYRAR